MDRLKVLITVKTYPIPSAKYDELVCTAGVTEGGQFIRLYPINFRDLPYSQQYKKYQWIEVLAEKHKGRDRRKESYRPDCNSIQILGEPIPTGKGGDWSKRAKFVLPHAAQSLEELCGQQDADKTSLGIFRPKSVTDLVISADDADWSAKFKAALCQARLWDDRTVSKQPPRKVPFKFHYHFGCNDARCKGHKMMIEDWEVGALYWNMVDKGATPTDAAEKVRYKFLNDICGPNKNTFFYVGTVLAHGTWVIIGTFFPKKAPPSLFD